MTFSMGLTDRLDNLRIHRTNTSSSNDDPAFSFYNPTPRVTSSRPVSQSSAFDTRNGLQRRFTTQSVSTLSSLSTLGGQRRSVIETNGINDSMFRKSQILEKKQAEYEYLRQKKLQFQQEMDRIEALENRALQDMAQYHEGAGQQSEPSTPPEFQENGFPSVLSRPNRFSASGIISPPGVINRPSRAGSQVTSPPVERARAYQALTGGAGSMTYSVPGSRNDSEGDEGQDEYSDNVLSFNHRGAAARNRNSMPVTRRDHRQGFADLASALGGVDTATFLFGDEEEQPRKQTSRPASGILSMSKNGDNFPVLIRSDVTSAAMSQSTSNDALDRVHSQNMEAENNLRGWSSAFTPHNVRASMPAGATFAGSFLRPESPPSNGVDLSLPAQSGDTSPTKTTSSNRHSMSARVAFTETKRPAPLPNPVSANSSSRVPTKIMTSLSTSSVPTVSSLNDNPGSALVTPTSATAEQRFHSHNASLGRIPAGAINNRHSRDLSTILDNVEPETRTQASANSVLHAQAPTFGPTPRMFSNKTSESAGPMSPTNGTNGMSGQTGQGTYISMDQMHILNAALNTMQIQPGQLAQQQGFQSQPLQPFQAQGYNPGYQAQGFQPGQYQAGPVGFGNYQQYNGARGQDSQARVIQQRRNQGGEESSRFNNIPLKDIKGEIYGLCKDQHGCRYLQKKLEERNAKDIQMIFEEIKDHMADLMIDPFGNYLCQKLLEVGTENHRTMLINNSSHQMVHIALNQHGTRALQKMIEYVVNEEQIRTVIHALRNEVVRMIQDLNGNHVIQKCLNHLTNTDAQFIFDAVANNCVAVGTHRHGCCVIQRCIDHATGDQKQALIAAITRSAMPLIQDPFGNYVLQYILDQNEPRFSSPMCHMFIGKISALSRQKFSSNVVEKCLRIAEPSVRSIMIQEIVTSPDFERLADDPYSNYVVQTAWEYATIEDQKILCEKVRPLLYRMRHKPYGRRFQGRVTEMDRASPLRTLSGTDDGGAQSGPGMEGYGGGYHIQRPSIDGMLSGYSGQNENTVRHENRPYRHEHGYQQGGQVMSPPQQFSVPMQQPSQMQMQQMAQQQYLQQAYAGYNGHQSPSNGMNGMNGMNYI